MSILLVLDATPLQSRINVLEQYNAVGHAFIAFLDYTVHHPIHQKPFDEDSYYHYLDDYYLHLLNTDQLGGRVIDENGVAKTGPGWYEYLKEVTEIILYFFLPKMIMFRHSISKNFIPSRMQLIKITDNQIHIRADGSYLLPAPDTHQDIDNEQIIDFY